MDPKPCQHRPLYLNSVHLGNEPVHLLGPSPQRYYWWENRQPVTRSRIRNHSWAKRAESLTFALHQQGLTGQMPGSSTVFRQSRLGVPISVVTYRQIFPGVRHYSRRKLQRFLI